jgi:Protein of unknown function (DUF3106)
MTELHLGRIFLRKTYLIVSLGSLLALGWLNAAAQTSLPSVVISPPGPQTSNANPNASRLTATSPISSAWQRLTPMQRQALAPLGAQWSALSAQQQAKWLTLSKNFTQLPVADQVTMHSRMADWVDLSPQQRNLARLNFNQFQNLPKEDKKAAWEAYQALPKEEKRLLSSGSNGPTKSAAPTIKPVDAHRQVQTTVKAPSGSPHAAAAIDRKTLLPRQPTVVLPKQGTPLPSSTDMSEDLKPSTETAPS